MDLVIQSTDLPTGAIEAFKVACLARRVVRKVNAARLLGVPDDADTRKAAAGLGKFWNCDWALVDSKMALADFQVLAMDMDSTLITIETLDEVAALAGKGREVAAITQAAMRGEIADYRASLRKRVALLAGTDAALLERVYEDKLQLSPGADRLVSACRKAGLYALLATGGFTFFAERLQKRLQIDAVRCNELVIAEGRLTGRVTGPNGGDIIDADGKAQALRDACTQKRCPTSKAIAVGDGANDLKMLGLAGLSVAYRAKPVVQAQTRQALNFAPLDGVLEWFAAER
jgi:phosphoserine phosphatase